MKRFDQINVIPFIDIMLVLLAIVLTTASFIAQGKIPLELPVAQSAEPLQSDAGVEIAVDRQGSVHFDGEVVHRAALGLRLDRLGVDTRIVLRVDADARFADFVSVVDALKARELNKLTIVTRPAP